MNNLSPVAKAALTTFIFVVALIGFWFLKDVVIDGRTFNPQWPYIAVFGVVVFATEMFYGRRGR
ncbi:MAG: hypothetical protein Q4A01_03970 [Coriobacteriales bacterium]|nr:hypothetical protein [Coriobacteriales bacterium]